jgi:hypothetical protein
MNIQKRIRQLIFFLSILLLATSCSELEKKTETKESNFVAKSVVHTEKYDLQVFEFDARTGGEIVGDLGTRLTFSPFSFIDMNEFIVDGKIKLELKEFYVDVEGHSHVMSLKEENRLLSDCSFELRAYEGKLPLLFQQSLDIASVID